MASRKVFTTSDGVAKSASDDESFIAHGASFGGQSTRTLSKGRARFVLIDVADARPRYALASMKASPHKPEVVVADGSEVLNDVARPLDCDMFVPTPPIRVEDMEETPEKMTIYTCPLFEPCMTEDDQVIPPSPDESEELLSQSSYAMISPDMMTHTLTLKEEFAQTKVMLEELKQENEEKSKQISSLKKKLEEHPESSKHNEKGDDDTSNDGDNESKKRDSGGSFTVEDIQEMISNAIIMQFGEKPRGSHHYIKPYTKIIDHLEIPPGYKPPKFQMFDKHGNPKQNVVHFVETCNNAGTEGDLLVKQFVRSLSGIIFDGYTDLAHQSIDSWRQMEDEFLQRFYNTRRVVNMVELTKTKQIRGESVTDYINRWSTLRLECKDRLFEISAVEICIRGMNLDLVYIHQGIKSRTFQELATRAHDMEITITRHGGQIFSSFKLNPRNGELHGRYG